MQDRPLPYREPKLWEIAFLFVVLGLLTLVSLAVRPVLFLFSRRKP